MAKDVENCKSDIQLAPKNVAEKVPADTPDNSIANFFVANLKYVALVCLIVQNSSQALLMRHIRSQSGPLFLTSVAVVCAEIVKMIISTCMQLRTSGGVSKFLDDCQSSILEPRGLAQMMVPSLLYLVQNNLQYLAISNLDASTFQVLYQGKILTTAIVTVFMLNRTLSKRQWFAIVVIGLGVAAVVLSQDAQTKKPPIGRHLLETAVSSPEQNPTLGYIAVLAACFCSAFAGVYFEKVLKGTSTSVWGRNIQLSLIGVTGGMIGIVMNPDEQLHVTEKGVFFGFSNWVWATIMVQAAGGLIVAVVVKYADNILKNLATSIAIVSTAILSIIFLGFTITPEFTVGSIAVLSGVYLYTSPSGPALKGASASEDKGAHPSK